MKEAANNTAISKTNDHGSGCSADGNLVVDAKIYDALLQELQQQGGYLVSAQEKQQLQRAYWDEQGRRTADTIARPAADIAAKACFSLPANKAFFLVEEANICKQFPYSTEKLGVVLSVFKVNGFDDALEVIGQQVRRDACLRLGSSTLDGDLTSDVHMTTFEIRR